MKDYFRHVGQSLARTFDFRGRSRRGEVIDYIVISAAVLMIVNGLMGSLAPAPVSRWTAFAVQYLILIPAAALMVRRFHDFGWSGRWTLVMLAVAVRNLTLDLLALLGGWDARRAVESALAYVDWVLFLPFVVLYLLLLVVPSGKGANRFGPDPRGDADRVADTAVPAQAGTTNDF